MHPIYKQASIIQNEECIAYALQNLQEQFMVIKWIRQSDGQDKQQ